MDPPDKISPTNSLPPSFLPSTDPSVIPKSFPPGPHTITSYVPCDTPSRYSVLSNKSTDTDATIPTAYSSQIPRFASITYMFLTYFIQSMKPTEVPSTPQSSPPHPDLIYF